MGNSNIHRSESRERILADLRRAARVLAEDEAGRRKALELAETAIDDGLDSIIQAERNAGIDPSEKWWR